MQKRIFKKTFPAQYLYPTNTDIFQFVEDYYTVFEGVLDGTNVCFYNRNKSVTKKTTDGGNTYEEIVEFENCSFFVAVDCTFDDIKNQVISDQDGIITELQ